ncbi:sulfurtransferase TusA family protein [Oecophyllibacter saccharovorans]|nr:sulfurtransferase TusA family protein [Oecophyllibacter saccharovorans]
MSGNDLQTLDIRHLICPMTSVHLRLALDQLPPRQQLRILLHGRTTLHNVRAMLATLHRECLVTELLPQEVRQPADPEDHALLIEPARQASASQGAHDGR